MKKVVLVLLLAIGLSPIMNSQVIKGIGDDKIMHFAAGAFFGAGTQAIVYSQTGSYRKAFIYGLAASFSIGLLKEVIDEKSYGGFDNKDLLATFLGGVVFTVPLNFSWKCHKKRTNWVGIKNENK